MGESGYDYTFTVFTGTHNRGHTLHRPYDSLRAQTFRDFEWLVIDNESTDGTPDLMARLTEEADFPVRYLYQQNIGHHGSVNRAVREARGRLFVILDSDDACVPEALERFKALWDAIPDDERDRYSAVTGLCRDEHGNALGERFPFDPTDSNATEIRYRYHVTGEKWGFQRTDVMREFPYPSIPGYTGMLSGRVVWGAIGRRYRTRYVNEYLGIVTVDQPDTLTKGARNLRRDAIGERLEAWDLIEHDLRYARYAPVAYYLKAAKFVRSALFADESLVAQGRSLPSLASRLLWLAAIPLGLAVYGVERLGLGRFIPGRERRGVAR